MSLKLNILLKLIFVVSIIKSRTRILGDKDDCPYKGMPKLMGVSSIDYSNGYMKNENDDEYQFTFYTKADSSIKNHLNNPEFINYKFESKDVSDIKCSYIKDYGIKNLEKLTFKINNKDLLNYLTKNILQNKTNLK